jgi:eukaryotic-like serine/threonine-protein kinase
MGSSEEEIEFWKKFASTRLESIYLQSEKQREITIEQPYFLGRTEVTIEQFRKFVEETNYVTDAEKATHDQAGGFGWQEGRGWHTKRGYTWKNLGDFPVLPNHPVVNVSWPDAKEFCDWLSQRSDRRYRLPSEAEWEYACRGGNNGRWCFGDDEELLLFFAYYAKDGNQGARPVAKGRPNPFGLFDMHGNLMEWCRIPPDPIREELPPAKEIGNWLLKSQPVRGGYFQNQLWKTRSAARWWLSEISYGPTIRVLLEIVPR